MIDSLLVELAERALVPDAAIRWGVRRILARRIAAEERLDRQEAFLAELDRSPVALVPDEANRQHYEVPAELFALMLGPQLKYSACLWESPRATLAEAEAAMLDLTCKRADIRHGQRILDLGCGWGALSLWMALRDPTCSVVAVSHSENQRRFIEARAPHNLAVITADVNELTFDRPFERVVSVEMFEHLRNHGELLRRIASWLAPGGKLFVHHFCHRRLAYPYETHGEDDWMARNFFTGGMMPSAELLLRHQQLLAVEERWLVSGLHYARTLEAWLARLDSNASAALPILARAYGAGTERRWLQRWRMFLLACAELFAANGGEEWLVAHYRFEKRGNR
ncbi:MAG: cyclopropane-fatty-acyl-phospholipid synthase family protein [bacterium]